MAISFIGITVLLMIAISFNISNALYKETVSKGANIAETIATQAKGYLTIADGSQFQDTLNQYKQMDGISYIYATNENGQPLFHTFTGEFQAIDTTYQINESTRYTETFHAIELTTPILYGTLGNIHLGVDIRYILAELLPSLFTILGLGSLFILLTIFFVRGTVKSISKPLNDLTNFSKDCINYKFDLSKVNQHKVKTLGDGNSEISNYAKSVYQFYNELESRMASITEEAKIIAANNHESKIARDIQQTYLPTFTNKNELFNLNGYLAPSKNIGGDFYDAIEKEGKVYFYIGDISSTGVEAVIAVKELLSVLKSGIEYLDNISEIIGQVNQTFCKNNQNSDFVSLFIGVFEIETGSIEYINAGHPNAIIKGKEITECESTKGIAIGINPDAFYITKKITLKKDESIILYTNGLTGTLNKDDELFGIDTLKAHIDDVTEFDELSDSIMKQIIHFRGKEIADDDIAILGIEYTPVKEVIRNPLIVSFKNDINELTRVQDITEQFTDKFNIERKVEKSLNLILEELVSNIIFYGYRDTEDHEIQIKFAHSDKTVTINIEDDGIEFNPLTDTPEINLDEEQPIGGLGVKIIQKMATSIDYERDQEKNKVTITKEFA